MDHLKKKGLVHNFVDITPKFSLTYLELYKYKKRCKDQLLLTLYYVHFCVASGEISPKLTWKEEQLQLEETEKAHAGHTDIVYVTL